MLKVLYGNLKFNKKRDWIMLPIKILYLIYTLPFLIFALLFYIRSLGAFGNPLKEETKLINKISIHFIAIFISFILWIAILSILENVLNIKVRLHIIK